MEPIINLINVCHTCVDAINQSTDRDIRAFSRTRVFITKKTEVEAVAMWAKESITITIMRRPMSIWKEFSTVDFLILFSELKFLVIFKIFFETRLRHYAKKILILNNLKVDNLINMKILIQDINENATNVKNCFVKNISKVSC